MLRTILSHVLCCVTPSDTDDPAINERDFLIPKSTEPSSPSDMNSAQMKLQDRMSSIVRSKEDKMVNLTSRIPFNLHNQPPALIPYRYFDAPFCDADEHQDRAPHHHHYHYHHHHHLGALPHDHYHHTHHTHYHNPYTHTYNHHLARPHGTAPHLPSPLAADYPFYPPLESATQRRPGFNVRLVEIGECRAVGECMDDCADDAPDATAGTGKGRAAAAHMVVSGVDPNAICFNWGD